jgi:hypothetical protein
MIRRLLFITCGAYLLAAFPACAQSTANYHDSCGGDSCASDAYDLGYRDGREGHSYSSLPQLQNNPQYDAGFSEGEMDAMAQQDPLSASGSLLSAAIGQADSLTSQVVAAQERMKAAPRGFTALGLSAEAALVRRAAERQKQDPRQVLNPKTATLDCQTSSLDCQYNLLDRQTSSLNSAFNLTSDRILSIETNGYDPRRDP